MCLLSACRKVASPLFRQPDYTRYNLFRLLLVKHKKLKGRRQRNLRPLCLLGLCIKPVPPWNLKVIRPSAWTVTVSITVNQSFSSKKVHRNSSRITVDLWWRRGELNSRPKTHPQKLLRAQTVIAGVLLSRFPAPPASRHAGGLGELHDSWCGQSLPHARPPRNDA